MIKTVSYLEIKDLIPFAKKENLCFNLRTEYCAYFIKNKIVAFCGWMVCGNKVVLKNDYVLPEYRRQGIYKRLNNYRMNIIKALGVRKVESNLTDKSLPLHLSLGAKIIKKYKCCTKVAYENL